MASEREAPKTYYDPYLKEQVPVLTEAEVNRMWPYGQFDAGVPVLTAEGDLTGVPEATVDTLAISKVANTLTAPERLGKADMVNLPKHYARFTIEPIRFSIENNLNGFQFNILKYIMRYDAKNGVEDLKKAQRYLEMFIKFVNEDPDWWKAPG